MKVSDYSAWEVIIQIALICVVLLIANTIRRKVGFLRRSLLPTALLAGFIALGFKYIFYACNGGSFLINGTYVVNDNIMQLITYHGLAIGFIALGLKMTKKEQEYLDATPQQRAEMKASKSHKGDLAGSFKSGGFIASGYFMQAVVGLLITLSLTASFSELKGFEGLLLPMGYSDGPGQANSIGGVFEETFGFLGGRSFAIGLASMGFLWACIGGIIYMNIVLRKRGKTREQIVNDNFESRETMESPNEIPVAESVDKGTIQVCLIFLIYLITFGVCSGITAMLDATMGAENTFKDVVWGYGFVIGSSLALLAKLVFKKLRVKGIMTRQYPNNYLLNRISGTVFDFMITASILSIDMNLLTKNWVAFLLLSVIGGVTTLYFCVFMSKRLYPEYQLEGFLGMYGAMTGTLSTGIALLREVDPYFKTPAANDLVYGSTTALVMAAPMLLLLDFAPKSILNTWLTLLISFVALAGFVIVLLRKNIFKKHYANKIIKIKGDCEDVKKK